jgi:hypothetical protein
MFPELRKALGSKGDREAAIGINTRACEAILQDMIGNFDKGFEEYGPGVLNVRLSNDKSKTSEYVTQSEINADIELARKHGDNDIAEAMGDVAAVVDGFNFNKAVLLLLVDNSGFRLLPVSRDNPAEIITTIMEELQDG